MTSARIRHQTPMSFRTRRKPAAAPTCRQTRVVKLTAPWRSSASPTRFARPDAAHGTAAMGASESHSEHQYDELMKRTGFSLEQIKNLHIRFQHLSGNEETIRKGNLDNIPALAENPIKKQIIDAFFDKRNQSESCESGTGSFEEIGFEQFVMVMSHFRPPTLRTNEEEKMMMRKEKVRFLFNMHDTDGDGIINLEEYRKVVVELLSKSDPMGPDPIAVDTARAIADAAMLEVASASEPQMGPNDLYAGITFEHFEKMLQRLELESRMHIRFLDVSTTTMHCGKATMAD